MSAPGMSTLECPHCHAHNVSIGASGNAICPDCAHSWLPSDTPAATVPAEIPSTAPPVAPLIELHGTMAPPLEPFGMAPTDDVFGPSSTADAIRQQVLDTAAAVGLDGDKLLAEADALAELTPDDGLAYVEAVGNSDTYAERRAEFVGGAVVLEGGQVAELVAWTDSDGVVVRLSNDDLEEVKLSDVERMMPPIEEVEPVALPESEADMAPDLALALQLARVIVGAGAESLYRRDRLGVAELPPTGFLPTEPELLPVIERACGLAMAMLIEAFELDADDVIAWADIERGSDEEAAPTTEGIEDE